MKEFDIKETGMFVHEGFFDKFQKELEAKIDEQEAQKLDILKAKRAAEERRSIMARRWAIAACACVLIGMAPFAWIYFDNSSNPQEPVSVHEGLAQLETIETDMESDEIMGCMISDLDIYENFYADL